MSRGETAPSADLGGSSKYSNENFEKRVKILETVEKKVVKE